MSDPIAKFNGILKLKTLASGMRGFDKIMKDPNATTAQKRAASIALDKTYKKVGIPDGINSETEVAKIINDYLPLMKDVSELSEKDKKTVENVIESVSKAVYDYSQTGQIVSGPAEAFALASKMIPEGTQLGEVDLAKAANTFGLLMEQGESFQDLVNVELHKLEDNQTRN